MIKVSDRVYKLETVILSEKREISRARKIMKEELGNALEEYYSKRDEEFELERDKMVITSSRDGLHSERSKHYLEFAEDYRIKSLDGDIGDFSGEDYAIARIWKKRAEKRLGDEYWLKVERTHIHLEYIGYPIKKVM